MNSWSGRPGAGASCFSPTKRPDAVVHVDDQIADLEIAEVRHERAGWPTAVARARVVLPRTDPSRRRSRRSAHRADETRAMSWPVVTRTAALCRSSASAAHTTETVVGEQLDRSLCAAGRRRHEHDVVSARARLADFVDPVGNPAVILDRRAAGDVHGVRRAFFNRQLAHAAGRDNPRLEVRPGERERLVRGHRRGRAPACPPRSRATALRAFGRDRATSSISKTTSVAPAART